MGLGEHSGLPPGASVDQLIEYGLERYGQGDVDGALLAWERALSQDPDEMRAIAYVDYVRENYEMLLVAPRPGEDAVPFGLGAVVGHDAYDYEVEVTRGEQARVERYIESVDEGWFLDDEPMTARAGSAVAAFDLDGTGGTEADGPPSRPSMRQFPLPAEGEPEPRR